MAYPPTLPPSTRLDNTPLPANHLSDHNITSLALTDIINELGAGPKGTSASVTARLDQLGPVGEITMYGGASAPASYRLCDGGAISRTTFAALFAIIGTTYGAGDGSTTFNVPNLLSRFPVGKGASAWSDALNESGGAADAVAVSHTHTSQDHSHSSTDHSHTTTDHSHGYSGLTSADGSHNHGGFSFVQSNAGSVVLGTGFQVGTSSIGSDGYHQHSYSGSTGGASAGNTTSGASTGNTTGGADSGAGNTTNGQTPSVAGTNANLPPYLTVNFIIRTTA